MPALYHKKQWHRQWNFNILCEAVRTLVSECRRPFCSTCYYFLLHAKQRYFEIFHNSAYRSGAFSQPIFFLERLAVNKACTPMNCMSTVYRKGPSTRLKRQPHHVQQLLVLFLWFMMRAKQNKRVTWKPDWEIIYQRSNPLVMCQFYQLWETNMWRKRCCCSCGVLVFRAHEIFKRSKK